jgi:hypothetical protein
VILALPKCVLLATELAEAGPGGGFREIGAGRGAGGGARRQADQLGGRSTDRAEAIQEISHLAFVLVDHHN